MPAALGGLAAALVTIAPRAIKLRTISLALARGILVPARASEFRTLVALTLEFRTVAAATALLARTRKPRTFITAAILTRPPGLLIAPIAASELAGVATSLERAILAAAPRLAIFVAIAEFAVLETTRGAPLLAVAARRAVITITARRSVVTIETLRTVLVAI